MAGDVDPYVQSLQSNYARNMQWAKPAQSYVTALDPQQQAQFQSWVQQNNVPWDPKLPVQDYDMPGFWLALQQGDKRARSAVDPYDQRLHFPDYWKTPYHESFSKESQWATSAAPSWSKQGRFLVDAQGNILFDSTKHKEED